MATNGKRQSRQKNFKVKIDLSWKNLLLYGFLFIFGLFMFLSLTQTIEQAKTVPLSQVIEDVKKGNVKEIQVSDNKLIVETKQGKVQTFKEPGSNVYQIFNNAGVPLKDTKVAVRDDTGMNNFVNVLSAILPIALMIAFFYFLFRQARGAQESIFSFGQSRAKLFSKDQPQVTFADVAGVDEAKQELSEIVDFLKHPGKYKAMGARTPKGVLMVGPSGTGKTLLARATAGEASVPFFSMAGSEFMEMLVGVGASVTGDTPILIKQNGQTSLLPIGTFVDRYYANNEEGVVPVENVYTLGFERGGKKGFFGYNSEKMQTIASSAFKKVSSVFRHKVSEIYEIHYLGGVVKTTADHSVFVRKHGRIIPVATKDLTKGDVLVELPLNVRLSYVRGVGQRHKVIAHQFSEVSSQLLLDVWNDDPLLKEKYAFVMAQKGVLRQNVIAVQVGVSQMTVSHWQNDVHMPQRLSKKLVKLDVPETVAATPSLLKLFGFYTAEGRGTNNLEFTFGAHETHLHKIVTDLMRDVFGIEPVLEKTIDNAVRIKYYSAHLGRFFAKHCGNGSHKKHAPEFLWDLPREYFLSFLEGYWQGDGYQTKSGKLSMTSVSKQLILELSWLCSMHGIKVGIKHGRQKGGRVIKSKPLPDGDYWNLIIGKTSNPFFGENVVSPSQFKRAIVQKIVKKPCDGFVYDLCGVENEAFFGGEKPVLLHNSRVRDLFNTAKKAQPAIIFIDEVDAIGRQRGVGIMGGHDEREQTLNQILVEMDGFAPTEQLVVIAASVTGDTPIMIKKDGKVAILSMSAFVDSYYKQGEEGVEKAVHDVLTLGFNKTSSKTRDLPTYVPVLKNVRGVFRHSVNEIYEIAYSGGIVRTTGNHSVFIRDGNAIKTKLVSQLTKGDVLIDFPYKHVWNQYRGKRKAYLVGEDACSKIAYNMRLPVYVTTELEEQAMTNYIYAMEQGGLVSQQAIAQTLGIAQTSVSHWQRNDRLPRAISRAYFKHTLPEEVTVSPELCRLMGYYVAEGYARKEIDFCLNKRETALIKDITQLMQLIFNLKPHAVRTRGNAVNIVYQSRPLATFFVRHCGKGAHNKHVPAFLFEAPKEYFVEFLRGVFAGDGYQDKQGRGEITSVSKQLIVELNWLCRLHGIKTYMHVFTAKEGRIINGGKPLKAVVAYRLGWGKTANPFSNASKNLARLPRVQSVKKVAYSGYVYDLCGCDNEAFFGGESPVLLHNTNRPDVLDPALIRPGRFDRRVILDFPDVEGRKSILTIHAKGKPFGPNVDWEKVAKRTVGFSGADLENMLNEAAILAARLGKKAIDMKDLEEAATKVKLGPEKRRLQSDEDKKMTAYHEAGHAIVSWDMPHMDPVHRISIVGRGLSLGHTMMEPAERVHETKTHLLEQVAVMLGGRAAEQLVFNEMTSGASDDIAKATQVVRTMVAELGMSDLGPINLDGEGRHPFYEQKQVSPEMAAKIDAEVKKITDSQFKEAVKILTKYRETLDLLAKELTQRETIDAEEFVKLVGPKKVPPSIRKMA